MRSSLFAIFVLLAMATARGQQPFSQMPGHAHHHDCAHAKIGAARSGTYEQNPRLWHYDVKYYELHAEVDPNVTYISGRVNILGEVTHESLDVFVVELMNNMQVDSVSKGGQLLSFLHQNNEVLIELPEALPGESLFEVSIFYRGAPESSGFFSGFRTGTTPFGKPVLWTLSEPVNARQWWPVKQVLEDKADSVAIYITTPNKYMAGSNGLLTGVIHPTDSTTTYVWMSNYPIAYYLISLAVSEYRDFSFFAPLGDGKSEVLVQNFIYDDPAYLSSQRENIERTSDFLQVFSQLFGLYPFAGEKYGHATAPMGGGMEHQTLSTMSSFAPDLVAHELAHQWFGNSVTCATWSDIWINEGFASYSEYLAREMLSGEEAARQWLSNAYQAVIAEPGGSVYVPPLQTTDVWRIFNSRLSYRKGAALLHMLRNEINDNDLFFDLLTAFRHEFADSVATGDDFMHTANRITDRNWQYFFDQWYYGEGYPVFDIFWWVRNDSLFVRSVQQGSAGLPAFFATSLDFRLETTGQPQDVRFFQNMPDQTFSMKISVPVTAVKFDPDNWLLKKASIKEKVDEGSTGVKVYPNPFFGHFHIYSESPLPKGSYRLFDMRGNLLLQGKLEDRLTKVQINQKAAAGIYLLEIISGSKADPLWIKMMGGEN